MKLRRLENFEFVPVHKGELSSFKERHHKAQHGVCPIIRRRFPLEEMVVDHKHKIKKTEAVSHTNGGLIRGVIHRNANQIEGIIKRGFKRFGLDKMGISIPEFLRNLADYLETPPIPQKFIHPSELPRTSLKRLSKTDFNRVLKYWSLMHKKPRKPPEYPKSGRMSDQWVVWIKQSKEIQNAKKAKPKRKTS